MTGRGKSHVLDPVPIRSVHHRWIDEYPERHVAARVDRENELERDHDDD